MVGSYAKRERERVRGRNKRERGGIDRWSRKDNSWREKGGGAGGTV